MACALGGPPSPPRVPLAPTSRPRRGRRGKGREVLALRASLFLGLRPLIPRPLVGMGDALKKDIALRAIDFFGIRFA